MLPPERSTSASSGASPAATSAPAESTGSIGVVTLNMPRLAYLAKDEADFTRRLDKLMDIARAQA